MQRLIKLFAITSLLLTGSQAGLMITPNNPVPVMFDHLDLNESTGNMTVYLLQYMMPEPEPGITWVHIIDSHDSFCGDCD